MCDQHQQEELQKQINAAKEWEEVRMSHKPLFKTEPMLRLEECTLPPKMEPMLQLEWKLEECKVPPLLACALPVDEKTFGEMLEELEELEKLEKLRENEKALRVSSIDYMSTTVSGAELLVGIERLATSEMTFSELLELTK